MKYNELTIGRNSKSRRVGRGIAAGRGKTAGRGTKGQNSRTGSSRRPGFEGGQNPLAQRLPKLRGFNTHTAAVETVSTSDLKHISGSIVDSSSLANAGLISNPFVKVKLLYDEELTKKFEVHLPSASQSAVATVKKAGGSFKKTPQKGRSSSKIDK